MGTNIQNTNSQANATSPTTGKVKQEEVGALWKRQSQKGQKYLAGTIKYDEMGQKVEMKVVVFAVDNKTNPNSPDFRIYRSNAASKTTGSLAATVNVSNQSKSETTEEEVL